MSRAVPASPVQSGWQADATHTIPLRSPMRCRCAPSRQTASVRGPSGPEPPSGSQTGRFARTSQQASYCGAGRGWRLQSFHVAVEDKETISKIVLDNVSKEARLFTDESRSTAARRSVLAFYETVNHSVKEYHAWISRTPVNRLGCHSGVIFISSIASLDESYACHF
jgi:hypothetical protein